MRRHASSAVALAVLAAAPAAAGGPFTLTLDAEASSVALEAAIAAALPGSLIGDWDEKANPDGTLTRPGLFGGEGNLPVEMSLAPMLGGALEAAPTGGLALELDGALGVVGVSDLVLTLGDGEKPIGALPLTVELLYETFRTFQPTSLFPGGVPLPLPLGEAAIEQVQVVQAGPGAGTLVATGAAGTFDVEALVPCTLAVTVTFLGTPLDLPPVPLPLVLAGTLVVDGTDAVLETGGALDAGDVLEGPFPGVGFEDLPLPLPTVLPPGGTANLLLSAELATVELGVAGDATLRAAGVGPAGIPGDVDRDGDVDMMDAMALLGAWGGCAPGALCPADLDDDGLVGFEDLLVLLAGWTG